MASWRLWPQYIAAQSIEGPYGAVRNVADIAPQHVFTAGLAKPLAAIVLDYDFLGAQIGPLSQLRIPIILGTHNLESAVTSQVVKGSLAAIGAVRLRRAVEFAQERLFFREADAVLCVSEEDRMAARTPVITTSKGCEGIAHAGAFQVADDAASFREGVLRVLDDPAGSARHAERARSVFDTEYNLPANAVRLAGALEAAKRAASKRAKPRAHPCYSCANGLVS